MLIGKQSAYAQKNRQADWQQNVNYHIDVTLDDQKHILRGFETMEYVNNSPNNLDSIYIHLWPNAYKNDQTAFARQMLENGDTKFYFSKEESKGYIDSLDFFVNGKSCIWKFDDQHQDIAILLLDKPLKSGEKCKISSPFLVKIPEVFSRLGHEEQTYNITQWYPKPAVYDVNGWHPMPYLNQGEFYSEFGNFEVRITLPKNYIVAATGLLSNQSEEAFRNDKGKNTGVIENTHCKTPLKTVEFKQKNIHDFAWFASKNFGLIKDSITVSEQKVYCYVYSQNQKELNNSNVESIKTAIRYYSENAGVYPYQNVSVVKSELKAGGGMEYPMITICDILTKEVIIHEVGHNWFYGILANNERDFPWMDESINSFFESEAMNSDKKIETKKEKRNNIIDNLNDYSMELLAINAVRQNTSQAVGLQSEKFTDLNYGTMVYGKGALIFKHLRAYLGEELFKKCFTTYYDQWKFRHPLDGDMQAVFEKVSGKDLDWFFRGLIKEDKKIDLKPTSFQILDNGNYKVGIKTTLKGMAAPVSLLHKDQVICSGWTTENEIIFPKDTNTLKITSVVVDHDRIVFDANRKNDALKTKGILRRLNQVSVKLFTRPDNQTARNLYVLPLLGGNIHNGFMFGAGLHNWSYPEKKLEYFLAPLWSFKTQNLNGYANLKYRITPKSLLEHADIGVNHASFAYQPASIYGINSGLHSFFRTRAFIHFKLKPGFARSLRSNVFKIEYNDVHTKVLEKSDQFDLPAQEYGFMRIQYEHTNSRKIDPYSIRCFFESGKFYDQKKLYLKPGLEIIYFKNYMHEKKGFSFRFFTGNLYGDSTHGLFNYRMGYKNGIVDYGMQQVLMGRGAETGIWSRNITPGEDEMKIKGWVANFTKPFIVLNLSSTLPGKIPLRPYADLCLNQDKDNFDNNTFIYTGGVAVYIIQDILEIYFPIVQSKIIEDYSGNKNFGQKICFSLNLNLLEPHNLFKKIKLF